MKPFQAFICVLLVFVYLNSIAFAGDFPVVSEVRLGVFAHDVNVVSFNRESGTDLQGELLFFSPDSLFFQAIGEPYPHMGVKLNSKGHTSQAYAGMTWRWHLKQSFFLEGVLGGAIHDGNLDLERNNRKALGSRMLFRLGAAIGYELSRHINLTLMFDHISNADLKEANEGLDTIGIMVGYQF